LRLRARLLIQALQKLNQLCWRRETWRHSLK
jgi:hypothetical protein